MTTGLEVRGLAHRYASREVLRGVDFEVRRGEVFGLLGPNGSGKSTALAVLAGLIPRQQGSVTWDGRPVGATDRAFRTLLGVVFQRAAIDPKLTARQNLELAAALAGLSRATGRARAAELLARAGLSDRAGDLTSELSGGMRRRLELARAMVHEPRLMLMDEPTSGLDEASFRDTWQRLAQMREGRDVSVLVATHRPEEAERCDRLAVLLGGRIVAVETPRALQALVSKDVVVLRGADPAALAAEVSSRLGVAALVQGADVLVESERGHELIPRLVEALPEGRLDSVSLRRPSLADAFLKVTGSALSADAQAGAA